MSIRAEIKINNLKYNKKKSTWVTTLYENSKYTNDFKYAYEQPTL